MKPTLVVLAAGMGSRYGGLKQLDPVGPSGEIILDYSIFDALRGGFGKVVFVIRRDIEAEFRKIVSARWEKRVEVAYAFQQLDTLPNGYSIPEGRVKPWGTGHAVLCARDVVPGAFSVINADDFYGSDGYAQLGKALSSNTDPKRFHMVGYPLNRTLSEFGSVSRGICRTTAEGMLIDVTERTKLTPLPNGGARNTNDDGTTLDFTGEEPASMNFWGFTPVLFDGLAVRFDEFLKERGGELKSEFYLPASVGSMVAGDEASVKVLKSTDSWFGVTYREDKPRVQKDIVSLIEAGRCPANLFA